jgi:peptidoglycan L-alanyl-D-glutamate endopeptidase CwlK
MKTQYQNILESILNEREQIEEGWGKNLAAGALAAGLVLSPMLNTPVEAKPSQQVVQDISYQNLDPKIINKIRELHTLAKKQGLDFKVIEGYRSQARQDELYAQGRTKPGKKVTWTRNSKHTSGKAFDIMVLKNGKGTWDIEDYIKIGKLGKSLGLVWGGDFKGKDFGHFQLG